MLLPRCKKRRCCRYLEQEVVYKPVGQPLCGLGELVIAPDELEAMRLCDLEGLDQSAAGERMGISRGTVQRLLSNGRRKLLEALVNSQAIRLQNEIRKNEEE